ncbi:mucin-2 protein [Nocardioides soli]|uniref:Uncharacterized protein YraI n=1 Tax=Nocardioides soli TaxID=1036020 RepID=A0A7W4VY28_9ACTN|nr:mucin-2 protein [Nocardioides soli]MBB3043901.1 uncharacterized protein YraI [Nocardioides soli]
MADHRHKRETSARRKPRAALVAAPIALLATGSAVTLGVLSSEPVRDIPVAQDAASISGAATREPGASRDESRLDTPRERKAFQKAVDRSARVVATRSAVRKADTRLWTTTDLNLWTGSGDFAAKDGETKAGKRVLVTGRRASGRVEIVVEGESRWVTQGYLSQEKPTAALSVEGNCTNGTSVSPGVSPNIVAVHEAVCANFPEISTYGTFRGDGEHSQGLAVDIMVSGDRGWQVANFVRENFGALGVNYVIYSQRIWSVERSGEGWRAMSNRGSATANHYDHVHVTTY